VAGRKAAATSTCVDQPPSLQARSIELDLPVVPVVNNARRTIGTYNGSPRRSCRCNERIIVRSAIDCDRGLAGQQAVVVELRIRRLPRTEHTAADTRVIRRIRQWQLQRTHQAPRRRRTDFGGAVEPARPPSHERDPNAGPGQKQRGCRTGRTRADNGGVVGGVRSRCSTHDS
jgi:hypothetical protein